MTIPLCALLRPCRIAAVLSLLALCGTAWATPVISTTTRAGTSSAATGTAISGRAPLPVVVDVGSGTTGGNYDKAVCAEAGAIPVRIRESTITTATYTDASKTVVKKEFFSDLETDGNEAEWTASADSGAYFYVGSGLLAVPGTVRASGSALTVGTCGALANGQWNYCNRTTIEGSGGFALYVQVAAGDPDGQAAGYIDSYRGAFSTLSWEKLDCQNLDITAGWTASVGDTGALYDNGTGVHGKPIAIKLNNDVIPEGTVGSLANEEWGWGDVDSITSNRIYVQSAAVTPTIHAIYGDGTHVLLSGTGVSLACYEISTMDSDDQITLVDDAGSDSSDVTIWAAVNPWTDIRYNFSVSCPNGGGNCIEDITNGDQRPGLSSTAIDETVGRGPIWAFVFKEGFGQDAIITITATDDANGGTDTQTIEVDETAWTGSTDYYISAAGNDTTGDGSIGNPWLTWTKLCNSMRTVSGARRGFLNRGDTFTESTDPTAWNSETDETLFTAYGSGADPIVTKGSGQPMITITENNPNTRSANIRFKDIDFRKTTGTSHIITPNGNYNCIVGCSFSLAGSGAASEMFGRGTAGTGYRDSVWWDNVMSCTNTNAQYGLVDSASETYDKDRVAFVGNSWDHGGGASTSSVFRTNHLSRTFFAYNKIRRNFASSSNPVVRVNYADGVYMFANYIIADGQSGVYTAGCGGSCGPGTSTNFLVDSDFWDATGSTIICTGLEVDVDPDARTTPEYPFVVKNTIMDGGDKLMSAGAGALGQAPGSGFRLFHNTMYTTDPNGVRFIGEDGTSDYANIKVINNIMLATVNNSNLFIDNDGNFARLPNVQILNNVWSIGAGGVMANVDGTTYTNPANWTAASGKAAQIDIESAPLLALPASNDFRLCTASGIPDASCSGASPCIDAGYDLPTVYYDYSGAVRNSDDVGAWDDDSAGMDMGGGSGPQVGSFMLMGVGR